jgi:hypothetical protein
VVARVLFSGAATMNFTVSAFATGHTGTTTTIGGTAAAQATQSIWATIGYLTLPANARPLESQIADTIQLSATANTGTHTLDELFLIDITHGSYTLLAANLGSFSTTRVWLDSPDADAIDNLPQIYIGAQADRSDASAVSYGEILSLGDHDLDPNGALVFTVTDGVDDAAVTASFYQRWHTHAAA